MPNSCRRCGCTPESYERCPGGCVYAEPDLCSRCLCDIYFVVPGRPQPKERPRLTRRFVRGQAVSRIVTPSATAAAEELFAGVAAAHRPKDPLTGPLGCDLIFWCLPAQSVQLAGKPWAYAERKPDIDNLVKLALDGLGRAGFFAVGDQQIAGLSAVKVWSATPRTTVRLWKV